MRGVRLQKRLVGGEQVASCTEDHALLIKRDFHYIELSYQDSAMIFPLLITADALDY